MKNNMYLFIANTFTLLIIYYDYNH